jgi:hypothetical protein
MKRKTLSLCLSLLIAATVSASQKPAANQASPQKPQGPAQLDANDARLAVTLQQGRLDIINSIDRLLAMLKQTSLTDSTRVVGIAGDIKEMLLRLDTQIERQNLLLAQLQQKYDCKNCQWGEGFQSLARPDPSAP